MTHKIYCAPADGGSTGGAMRRELLASRMQKRLKAVVIDGQPNMVIALRLALDGVCDVPSGIKAVRSFDEARKSVEGNEPDLVICGKGFDANDPGAHVKLLFLTKALYPGAKVILHTGHVEGEDAHLGFDAIVRKGEFEGIVGIVKRYSSEAENRIVADEIEETTDRVFRPPIPAQLPPEDDISGREWDNFSTTTVEKKGKLIVIERDKDAAIAYAAFFSMFCDVPDEMPAVGSFESALALVRETRPSLVVITKGFDQKDPQAHLKLLDAVKEFDPGTRAILYGENISEEDRGTGRHRFDAAIEKRPGSAEILKEKVRALAA